MGKSEIPEYDGSVTTMADLGASADGDNEVSIISPPGKATETAKALLDAAESLGLDPGVVRTSDGHFVVPEDVADAAYDALPEGDVLVEGDAVGGLQDDGSGSQFEVPESFGSRDEAKAFADEHELTIDGASGLSADEYKDAVIKAAQAKRNA